MKSFCFLVAVMAIWPQAVFSQLQGLSYSATCLVGSTLLNQRLGRNTIQTPIHANLFSHHALWLTQQVHPRFILNYGIGWRRDGYRESKRGIASPLDPQQLYGYYNPGAIASIFDISLLAAYKPVKKWPLSFYAMGQLGSMTAAEIYEQNGFALGSPASYRRKVFPLIKPKGYFGSRPSMNLDMGLGIEYEPSFAPNLRFRAGYQQGLNDKFWFRRVALGCSYMLPFRKQN